MFDKGEELLKLCKENNETIYELTIKKEMDNSKISYDELIQRLRETLAVMESSSSIGLDKEVTSASGLIAGDAKKVQEYVRSGKSLSGDLIVSSMAKAFSTSEVNASMGKIVAAPTAGASGILPSVLFSAKAKLNLRDDDLIKGLLTAGAIGEIIARNATISGAEGGCQAECGTAAAMGASAIVEMTGGSPDQALDAASFALTNIMGLVCDPIAGLVEYPCSLRNASGVVNSFISADLALAGVKSLVPFDEVVEAMYEVGQALPTSLRETALGGLATTPTGEHLRSRCLRNK